MAISKRTDPLKSFCFRIEIDGIIAGGFSEVSGIQAETKVFSYREGGNNSFTYKFPEVTEYPNLVMKKGLMDKDVLWDWHRQVISGNFDRKNGSIILLDSNGEEKARWSFYLGYPVKWSGPDLKADASSVAFESIELVHMGLYKV